MGEGRDIVPGEQGSPFAPSDPRSMLPQEAAPGSPDLAELGGLPATPCLLLASPAPYSRGPRSGSGVLGEFGGSRSGPSESWGRGLLAGAGAVTGLGR